MLRALESWFLVSVGLAALATLVLVVPHPYLLTRQVDGGQVDWLQKDLDRVLLDGPVLRALFALHRGDGDPARHQWPARWGRAPSR